MKLTAHVILIAATQRLASAGIEESRLNAELLLAHVWGIPRLQMLVQLRREMEVDALDRYEELLERRARREPLQHILGHVQFLEHRIEVSPAALIPRPETEVLVQRTLELMPDATRGFTVADFGTGTGCIAISIAAARPLAQVHAIDVSREALALARRNALRAGVADRIQFHEGDGLRALPARLAGRLDVLVSNPPYIPAADIPGLEPEVREFDPLLALNGGPDGMDFFRALSHEAPGWLKGGGWIALEFGDGQAEAVKGLFQSRAWAAPRIERDLTGRERVGLVQWSASLT